MTEIAKTAQYEIAVDEIKNRVYLKIYGFWKNPQAVAGYISDWQKTMKLVKPNFTLLTDLTTMVTHPPEVTEVHKHAQEIITAGGLKFTAEVKPKDIVTAMQLTRVAKKSQMPMKQFDTFEKAEAFLNSFV